LNNAARYTRKTFIPAAYRFAWRVLDGCESVEKAIFESYDGIDRQMHEQRKNRGKDATAPTTPPFNEVDVFQYLLYKKLDLFEKEQEEKQLDKGELINDRLLILRYIKSLIRYTIRRRPFHLAVALCGLIYDIHWESVLEIHDTIIQSSDGAKDQNEFNLRRRNLKEKLIERFSSASLDYETDGNGMKKFSRRPSDDSLLKMVQEDLALHVPWMSEHFEFDGGSPNSNNEIPLLRSIDGGADEELEMSTWRNRSHALIDPLCFDKIINLFDKLQPLKDKLHIPFFKQTISRNKMNDSDSGSPKIPEEPTPEFYEKLFTKRDERERRRRQLKTKVLSVVVDGIEQPEQFNVEESRGFNLTVPGDVDTIELLSHDDTGPLPMAELSLEFYADALEEEPQMSFAVTREAGQHFEMLVGARRTSKIGESDYFDIAINYSEKNLTRALSLFVRRKLYRLQNTFNVRKLRVAWALAALTVLLSIFMVINLFKKLPESRESQIQRGSSPSPESNEQILTGNDKPANSQREEVPSPVQTPKNELTQVPFNKKSSKSKELTGNFKKPPASLNRQKTAISEVYASSGANMGNNNFKGSDINKQSSLVAVNLPIAQQSSGRFKVNLKSSPEWIKETTKVVNSKRGRAVRVLIPTRLLRNGNNTIILSELDNEGKVKRSEGYILRINKK
jgi:hypothetical protein